MASIDTVWTWRQAHPQAQRAGGRDAWRGGFGRERK